MSSLPRFRLTPEQYERLTMPLDSNRVGKNPKGFSHLEAWDVRRWLIRVFGFGSFDVETVSLDLVKELEIPPGGVKYRNGGSNDKTIWTVVYRAQVRLTVHDQYGGRVVLEDGACGDSTNQPSVGDCHDNAAKTALSQALKRCAVNLGDCFGLSLYNGGAVGAVVHRSLVAPAAAGHSSPVLPGDDAPVLPEPGSEPDAISESDETHSDRTASTSPATESRRRRMFALLTELGYADREQYQQVIAHVLRRPVASSKELTAGDVEDVITGLEQRKRQLRNQQRTGVAS